MEDIELLEQSLDTEQLEGWLFVICGPAAMMEAFTKVQTARGVYFNEYF